jgi:beta-phosphoglucomutase
MSQKLLELIKKKKYFIWDFDGTVVDTEPLHFRAYEEAFKKAGHTIYEEEYYYNFTHLGLGAQAEIEAHGLDLNPHEIYLEKMNIFRSLLKSHPPRMFEGLKEILELLKRHDITSVIASNSARDDIEFILGDVKKEFSFIIGNELKLRKKPFGDIFKEAMTRLNTTPLYCLVLEDSDRGLKASLDASCDALFIESHANQKIIAKEPHVGRLTHGELLKLLKSL